MTQTWVYALIAIAIGHFIATVGMYYYLAQQKPEEESESASSTPAETTDPSPAQTAIGDEDYVVCSSCDTPNEPGYRYCRQCVAPLGSGSGQNRGKRGPNAPWIR